MYWMSPGGTYSCYISINGSTGELQTVSVTLKP
jgi:hypothetical protein